MHRIVIIGSILCCMYWGAQAQLKVAHLLIENLVNPYGIGSTSPRFSWQLISGDTGVLQTAYEIEVYQGNKCIWQTGKVISSQSVFVTYKGPPLVSAASYQWQVKVWDNHRNTAISTEQARFYTGLLKPADWKAQWIIPGFTEDTLVPACPVFFKDFVAQKQVTKASLFITSHGLYEARVNNKRVGDSYFTPGWTSYDKRLQYQVYDITDLLNNHNNKIEVALGSGWYRGTFGLDLTNNIYGNTLALLFQLEIEYSDGAREWIVSDTSWRSATGPIRFSEIYHGEIIDARYTSNEKFPVKVAAYGFQNLIPSISEPVRKHETFQPISIFTTPAGDTVADFGQNLVGWVRVQVQGAAGDSIKLQHAEVLDKTGNFYTASLRTAKQQNIYVLAGHGQEVFEPHFTWQGFRYVKLSGFHTKVKPEQLQAVALYSDMGPAGTFECSDPLLNQLQHNITWSQRGNFLDIPTDCPQRDERLGWMGDAMVFCNTAAFNYNVHNFFSKWLGDVAADQFSNGALPQVVPNILGQWGGAAGWADAATVIPWTMYQVYGDTALLARQYPVMKAWVNYMESNSENFLWHKGFQFGDWLSFRSEGIVDRSALTDVYLVSQAFYAQSVQLLLKAAYVLEKREDILYYTNLLQSVKEAFLKEYVSPNGRLMSNTQTAYVLALQFNLLPGHLRDGAAKRLAENIASYNYHLTTGFLGTPYICQVLSHFGYPELAYKLLLQETYPSWLYPVKMGATTIWERWDGIKTDSSFQSPEMNSFNHYAYGAIGDWMYRTIGGINAGDSLPGYKAFIIKPRPGGYLQYAKASLKTYYGKISLSWHMEQGRCVMDVEVPCNTSAKIFIPDLSTNKYKQVNVGSGHYHFD